MGLIFKSDWTKKGHANEINITLEKDETPKMMEQVNIVTKSHALSMWQE